MKLFCNRFFDKIYPNQYQIFYYNINILFINLISRFHFLNYDTNQIIMNLYFVIHLISFLIIIIILVHIISIILLIIRILLNHFISIRSIVSVIQLHSLYIMNQFDII